MDTKNIVCLRHPRYDGVDSPDLSCKTCCSKFVAKIREDQKNLFEPTWNSEKSQKNRDFKPMNMKSEPAKAESTKRTTNFDGSWI
jgi:hypothetical protein